MLEFYLQDENWTTIPMLADLLAGLLACWLAGLLAGCAGWLNWLTELLGDSFVPCRALLGPGPFIWALDPAGPIWAHSRGFIFQIGHIDPSFSLGALINLPSDGEHYGPRLWARANRALGWPGPTFSF